MTDSNEASDLDRWFAQLQAGQPDANITKAAASALSQSANERLADLFAALTDPAADAQVAAWYQATIDGEIPDVVAYPALDGAFSFPMPPWVQQLETALAQGLTWVYDELGALCLAFRPLLPNPLEAWLATKAPAENRQLFRFELQSDKRASWEVEVTGFSEDEVSLGVEVAIMDPTNPTVDLTGLPITLLMGDTQRTQLTDSGGVAEFVKIPRAQLGLILLRVG